jgi:hypothetical protein
MERLPFVPLRVRIVWFTFGCQLLNVACFMLLGFCPSANPVVAQVAIIVVLCANGAGFVGLASNCQVVSVCASHNIPRLFLSLLTKIARQHAHYILAMYALINYIITLVQPLVIAWAAASKDKAELATEVSFPIEQNKSPI